MVSEFIDPALIEKQARGEMLEPEEARAMVSGLRNYVAVATEDVTISIILLAAVSSRYYEFVWDILVETGELANGQTRYGR